MLQQGILFDNRYELIRMLGRGGFAEVWLVKDTLTELEEALKIYAPGGGMDNDGLKVFTKELAVVHDLRHTNLLTPKSMGQYENQPYLILPYCPNGSLNKSVGQCTEEQAWKILEQVASGLAYLHKRNIVHQDIKPDNILVDANLDYVITDFGISLKAQSTLRKSMRIQAESGTMAYMAPERFSAEPHPIPANDVWSLGAMLFELVEGNVPFIAQMGGLAQMSGAQLPTMHANVSNNLKLMIASMLDLKPEDRPIAEEIVMLAKTKSAPKEQPSTKETKNSKTKTTATQPQPSETSADEKKTQRINAKQSKPEPAASADEKKTQRIDAKPAQQPEYKKPNRFDAPDSTTHQPAEKKEEQPAAKKKPKWVWWVLSIGAVVALGWWLYVDNSYLYVSPDSAVVMSDGGDMYVDVRSNRDWNFWGVADGIDATRSGSGLRIRIPENTTHSLRYFKVNVEAEHTSYKSVTITQKAKPWPWSPIAKQKEYNVEFSGGWSWNGWSIVLKDLKINNMLNKKCYIVIWFRDAKGHYLKTDYSEHQGYGGYACYVDEAKPRYQYSTWEEFALPAIDTSILDAPSGTKIYITLAVYAAANGKCIGKWKSSSSFYK